MNRAVARYGLNTAVLYLPYTLVLPLFYVRLHINHLRARHIVTNEGSSGGL